MGYFTTGRTLSKEKKQKGTINYSRFHIVLSGGDESGKRISNMFVL